MTLKLQYSPDETENVTYMEITHSYEDAIAFIGKLERIEQAEKDKKVLEASKSDSIPF